MQKLILVRHGETTKNVEDKLHSPKDIERLNETGIKQIKKTGEQLRKYLPLKIYTSREARALQSGEIIAKELNTALETVAGLEERNWGEFSGKSWGEVEAVLNSMSLENRYEYVPSQGESWKQFESRLIQAIEALIKMTAYQNIVVVAHGGVIRALMPYFLNAPKEESFKYNPDNASITIFNKTEKGWSFEI